MTKLEKQLDNLVAERCRELCARCKNNLAQIGKIERLEKQVKTLETKLSKIREVLGKGK